MMKSWFRNTTFLEEPSKWREVTLLLRDRSGTMSNLSLLSFLFFKVCDPAKTVLGQLNIH